MTKSKYIYLFITVLLALISNCSAAESLSHKHTDLVKKWIEQGALNNFRDEACGTNNVKFSASDWHKVETNFVGCLSGSSPAGNTPATSFIEAVSNANTSKLTAAVWHAPMPKNGMKLTDCKIRKIEILITNGTPDN